MSMRQKLAEGKYNAPNRSRSNSPAKRGHLQVPTVGSGYSADEESDAHRTEPKSKPKLKERAPAVSHPPDSSAATWPSSAVGLAALAAQIDSPIKQPKQAPRWEDPSVFMIDSEKSDPEHPIPMPPRGDLPPDNVFEDPGNTTGQLEEWTKWMEAKSRRIHDNERLRETTEPMMPEQPIEPEGAGPTWRSVGPGLSRADEAFQEHMEAKRESELRAKRAIMEKEFQRRNRRDERLYGHLPPPSPSELEPHGTLVRPGLSRAVEALEEDREAEREARLRGRAFER